MSERAKELSERFSAFNGQVIAFVEACSEEVWNSVCSAERWKVGIVARHIAAGHYGALGLARMIVEGEKLPGIDMDAINQANAQHARENADCTKTEVLDLLCDNGSRIADYVAGLSDADLERTGHLPVAGGNISAEHFIQEVIIKSGAEHLASMKAAAWV